MSPEPIFRPFDPHEDVRVYVRNLPHWRQRGATYFVTFRQDDSIPEPVLAEWLDRRERWYRAHGLDPQWRSTDPKRFAAAYRLINVGVRRAFEREQATMLHEELDRCHGSCTLRHAEPQRVLCDSLRFFHGSRLWSGDFVVMPNHVHAIMTPFSGLEQPGKPIGWELEELLGSIKKWTSRLIADWQLARPEAGPPMRSVSHKPRFWQHESYDRIMRDAEELTIFRRYIARNPAAARVRPGEYLYHCAPWRDAFAERPSLNDEPT